MASESQHIGLIEYKPLDFKDGKCKDDLIRLFLTEMFNRTQAMFKYNGLPEEIPQRIFELNVQKSGHTGVLEHKGKVYQTYGNLGGGLDYNYMPKYYLVANPYLVTGKFEVDKNVVVVPNDSHYLGLTKLNIFYATLLAENIISKTMVTVNSRAMNILVAPNESAKRDCVEFLNDLYNGEFSVIMDKNFLKNIDVLPFAEKSSNQTLTQLIEDQQYIKACWYNELGVQANYNMKRESINSNEAQLNTDALAPLVDDMLNQRQIACEKINKMFGLNVSVEFNSSWIKDDIEQSTKESNNVESEKSDETDKENSDGKDNETD